MNAIAAPFRRAAAALALVALLAPQAAAADADAAVVVDPPGTATGDADASLAALVGVVERDREGPLGQAALVVARNLWDASLDPAPHSKRIEALLAKGGLQADTEETIRRVLSDRAIEAGDAARLKALDADGGYLGDMLVAGPFGTSASAAVDVAYAPEAGIDLEKAMAGRRGPVRWMAYRNLGYGELVEPLQYLRPTDGVAYALAQLKSAAERPAVLKVTCRGPHAVFLNGARVLRVDRLRDTRPRTAWVPVTLGAGWNRILVKAVGSQGFMVKVCDATTGRPLDGLEVEKGMTLHPPLIPLAAPAKVGYRSNLDALLASEPATPEARTVRGLMAQNYDLPWQAWTDLERAAKQAPEKPGVVLRFAQFLQGFSEMPEPRWRKNRARGLYENVLEKSPGHVEAMLALAQILHGEDKTEEALAGLKELAAPPKEGTLSPEAAKSAAEGRAAMERSRKLFPGLDRLLADRPKFSEALFVRAQFCQDRNWWKESQEAAEKALVANPRSQRALGYLLRAAESGGNVARVEELCKRILEVDRGDIRAARRLSGLLRARGDLDGALKVLEENVARHPSDFDLREERATLLASMERWDAAADAWKELAALSPLEESYPRRMGEVLRRKGDAEGARREWHRSLSLSAGQGVLRRELERLEGADFDFARRWEVDGVAMAKEAGGQEKYPKALAVHVLDFSVVRVQDDGSFTTITHNVWKILNEQGREKYSEITVPARPQDILEVRAISPEGEVFLPIAPRGSTFTLEGLQAGWIVEWRALTDRSVGDRGFDSGGWYFQDPDFESDADPVVLSRYVVDMPESMDRPLLLRNYGAAPTPLVENGRKVWVFEKKDQDRIEAEPQMPGQQEICPWLWFYAPMSWEEINLDALEAIERFPTSPILEEKAREVAGPVKGNLAKARALYDFVNREITGNAGSYGPTGVLLEKSGNRFVLFGSLLRGAGVPFDPVRVSTGPESEKLWEVVDGDLYDESGILLRGESGDTMDDDAFVFPFARQTPFGRIPLSCRGKPALLPGKAGPTLFRMPALGDGDIEPRSAATVTLGAGAADTTFRLRLVDPGDGAYGRKERLKDMNEDDRKKETSATVGRYFESADVRDYAYPNQEAYGTPHVLEASGALPRILRVEGGETVLPLGVSASGIVDRYVERPERSWPFVVHGDFARGDDVVYDLGGRWKVKRLPKGHTASSKIGTYSLVIAEEGGKVRVERRVRFGDCRYTPDEYREFVAWCRAIDAAEEQRIALEEVR
jgi:tetratricopeptide (TPR) repeat protein